MTFSLILTGVLLILVCFNVGESIYKKLNIKKTVLVLFLSLTLALYFVPNINIAGVSFGWTGFVLPLIFSIMAIAKTKRLKTFLRMIVATLIAFALNIVYNLITFDVYESAILQPYVFLAIFMGIGLLFVVQTPSRLYASMFVGIILAEIVFYLSRYSIYGDYYLTIGSEKVFSILLTSFTASLLTFFFVRKVRTMSIRKRLKKAEKEIGLIN